MKERKDRSIRNWMENFSKLYSEKDADRTPEQMWIAVMAHSSSIGESIRKVALDELLNCSVHTFCWLCSFVVKCNSLDDNVFSIKESLPGIVSLKYPLLCGHCVSNPCKCDEMRIEQESNKAARYKQLFRRRERVIESFEGYSIKDCNNTFEDIYGGRIHIQTLDNIGFHFLEEIGEAAVCIRRLSQLKNVTREEKTGIDCNFLRDLSKVKNIVQYYDKYIDPNVTIDYASNKPDMLKMRLVEAKMGFISEIGDAFSWFCAILIKMGFISKFLFDQPEKSDNIFRPLEQILNETYFDSEGNLRCPSCGKNPCTCIFYN